MATLACPLCRGIVVEGAQEPAPGACPTCGAVYAGGGESPPLAAERALAHWGVRGVDAAALANELFARDPAPDPAPTAAITSDRRDGFYLWWIFVRGEPGAVLGGDGG